LSRALFAVVVAFALIPSASAMQLANDNIQAEATGPGGANVNFTVAAGTSCDHAPGELFPLGTTHVTCTDNSNPSNVVARFNVIVVDTTPPTLTLPGDQTVAAVNSSGATVTYSASASDIVDGTVVPSCTPASGTTFAIGTTPVSCTATDANGNSASGGFNVIVTLADDQPPTFTSVPSGSTTEATGPGGAAVSWTIAATDNFDANPTINCTPASGSTFAIGTTAVNCRATDASGNFTDAAPFNVTVQDTTPPTLTLPGDQNVETEDPGGKSVTYSVSASDIVSGSIAPSCNHSSGDTFPVGTTAVHCTATDGTGNATSGDFNVTVSFVDHTPPVLSGYGDKSVEANGPAGSVVNFPTPTAVDSLDGPIGAVSCTPASGSTFPLGTTTVNCSATDSHGNTGQATFNVRVADTTPPNLIVPAARSVYATTATGTSNTVSGVVSFLTAASATDIVDPSPVITNDAPSFLPVGNVTITFGARDASGNATSKGVTLTVLPQPPAGTPPLPIPPPPTIPAQPTNVRVTPLDGAVRIEWNAGGRKVIVTRSSSSTRSLSATSDEQVVYTGTESSYTDRGLTNGVEYRYVVMAVDAAGNHSAGVAAVAVPRRNLLKSPKDGAKLRKAPKLSWVVDGEAQYYNTQLLLDGKKILSVWPVRPSYAVKKSWKFEGRKYTLKPGVYTWFVWPGYGPRSAVDYGELMGSRTFQIVR
jgi:HYR domain